VEDLSVKANDLLNDHEVGRIYALINDKNKKYLEVREEVRQLHLEIRRVENRFNDIIYHLEKKIGNNGT
jgi:hypothetical protein